MAYIRPSAFRGLRHLLFGGEAANVNAIKEVLKHGAPERLLNVYGPTETTTLASWYLVNTGHEGASSIPIGRPIAHAELFVLDGDLRLVPDGAVGELCIGGSGLALGYLNRLELTAEKFVPNPFTAEPGARLYRTGDLARRLPDGNIEFLGRIDCQVKLRGFRIEPGEIENTLTHHPNVRQATVLVRDDFSGDKRLVAYVVCREAAVATAAELRGYLKTKLPEYMIPSAFVSLDKFPLTPNGKIDRAALPAPEHTRRDLTVLYVPPRTSIEKTLTDIWADVLAVCPVGIDDDFFELGGHSLKATQIVSRIRDAFEIELPLHRIFAAPTIAELAEVVARGDAGTRTGPLSGIVPVRRDGSWPLSFSQERAWFIQQLDRDNLAYNSQSTLRFTGPLDTTALERSLNEIVRRHEIFRTTFPAARGRPIQVIHSSWPVRLTLVDFEALPESEREAEAQRWIYDKCREPFDLAQLPLVRWTLLRITESEHIFVYIEHHLVHDGWSSTVFLRELIELYKAFSCGKPSPLPDLSIQFADFALWQRRWMQGVVAESQLAYWKNKLAGCPMVALPTDRPRPAVQSFHGAAPRLEIPLRLYESLRALSRHAGVTLFVTMLSAFLTLLHRYTGHHDICVGSGIANRRWRETEGLIGMMLNNIVLRVDFCGNPRFRELLQRVRDVTVEAYAHQDLPFDQVVQALQPERDLSRNPLFQVMFSFHDSPMPDLSIPGLNLELTEALSSGSAKFDLNIIVIPRLEQHPGESVGPCDGSMTLIWEYATDLFDPATIDRMIGHYQRLLEGMVADPDRRISDVEILSNSERHPLLAEWNDSPREFPKDRCIHELFEAQVEQTPNAVALVFEDQGLTYRELNRRANQLAHYLRKLSVGPEVLVGLCVERSLEMIVAILGILKAGGAYVPLDSSYPQERLAYMLGDSSAPVLITQSSLINGLPVHNAEVLCLDRDWEKISKEKQDNPLPLTTPEHLAYVIYTSGSTGIPKGALIAHHNVVRLFYATGSLFQFSQNDVWTLFHSYAFDFSVWEMWGALLHGGRLVIVPFEVSRSPRKFYGLLCREQVTVLNQTPSAFRQLVQAEESIIDTAPLALRLVIFGGEALEFQSLKPWFARHGDQRPRLVNMYGITETTVHVTYRVVKIEDVDAGLPSLIGAPIPDLEFYVLDSYRNLVAVGVPGELYVGGAGLARGYLNRPELTAERFVGHPFDDGKGRRLYRSGDLVRRRADGDIEYLGRIDNQVKIRGHRVELGEIESVLSQQSEVRESVVLTREDVPGDRRLVGYIVPVQGKTPSNAALRNFLKTRLPEPMVPATFVILDALPLTPNGKLDRKALPAPDQCRAELGGGYVAPGTATEQLLTEIAAGVLKLDKVGIHDNFFELGGHSLLATQVISRLHEAFGIELPLRTFFEHPTIAGLAKLLEISLSTGERYPPSDSDTSEEREEIEL
jgi:amino acid adenylation domain-containing protein